MINQEKYLINAYLKGLVKEYNEVDRYCFISNKCKLRILYNIRRILTSFIFTHSGIKNGEEIILRELLNLDEKTEDSALKHNERPAWLHYIRDFMRRDEAKTKQFFEEYKVIFPMDSKEREQYFNFISDMTKLLIKGIAEHFGVLPMKYVEKLGVRKSVQHDQIKPILKRNQSELNFTPPKRVRFCDNISESNKSIEKK